MALDEGDVGEGTGSIEYGGVSSCLTVTCLLEDGTTVGGHLSLMKKTRDSSEVLPAMKDLIKGRKVTKIHLAGVLDCWNPRYLTTPLFNSSGDSNYASEGGQLASEDMSDAVKSGLGADGAVVTSEEKEGAFTIDMS
jgi:hypothetical protein